MSAERDARLFFNIARIEEAGRQVQDHRHQQGARSDGTHEANKDPTAAPPTCRCPRTPRRERQPRRQVLHLRRQARPPPP